jgi:antitoxin YefM
MVKTAESHKPFKITGKRNNVVMISEEDWNAVSDTIYLNSVSGLAEEILQRRDSEDADFVKDEEMDW